MPEYCYINCEVKSADFLRCNGIQCGKVIHHSCAGLRRTQVVPANFKFFCDECVDFFGSLSVAVRSLNLQGQKLNSCLEGVNEFINRQNAALNISMNASESYGLNLDGAINPIKKGVKAVLCSLDIVRNISMTKSAMDSKLLPLISAFDNLTAQLKSNCDQKVQCLKPMTDKMTEICRKFESLEERLTSIEATLEKSALNKSVVKPSSLDLCTTSEVRMLIDNAVIELKEAFAVVGEPSTQFADSTTQTVSVPSEPANFFSAIVPANVPENLLFRSANGDIKDAAGWTYEIRKKVWKSEVESCLVPNVKRPELFTTSSEDKPKLKIETKKKNSRSAASPTKPFKSTSHKTHPKIVTKNGNKKNSSAPHPSSILLPNSNFEPLMTIMPPQFLISPHNHFPYRNYQYPTSFIPWPPNVYF